MKTLYLDCGMGAAGDMLTAALLELFPHREAVAAELNRLGVPGVQYVPESSKKCGITGTHMHVYVNDAEEDAHSHSEAHHHSGMHEIEHWISHICASDAVKQKVRSVYDRIAQAESRVHGVEIHDIHFHEVGTLDALADITAVCYLMEKLGNPKVVASPVHVGSGHVSCAHGILPVPAPATAEILKGVPIYGGQIQGELCTPTGAALLKQFASRFGDMPVIVPEAVGYGMGRKDFPQANCIRAILGDDGSDAETILELRCNLDDMTGEEIGFATEQLLAAGAPDVFTTPIGMKKNRPGVLLTVLCRQEQREEMIELIFQNTSTLGIRENLCRRSILTRREEIVTTPFGPIRQKIAEGCGTVKRKPEYEDLARIARQQGCSLAQLKEDLSGL